MTAPVAKATRAALAERVQRLKVVVHDGLSYDVRTPGVAAVGKLQARFAEHMDTFASVYEKPAKGKRKPKESGPDAVRRGSDWLAIVVEALAECVHLDGEDGPCGLEAAEQVLAASGGAEGPVVHAALEQVGLRVAPATGGAAGKAGTFRR